MPRGWVNCSEDRKQPHVFVYTCANGHSWQLAFAELEALIEREGTSSSNVCRECEKSAA